MPIEDTCWAPIGAPRRSWWFLAITFGIACVVAIESAGYRQALNCRRLFTALYQANRELLADHNDDPYDKRLQLGTQFWTEVSARIPGWAEIMKSDTSAAEIREGYVHCHSIGLAAIARAGRALLVASLVGWKKRLAPLSTLDWFRKNTKLWEGRVMIGGRLSKSSSAVALTGNTVMHHLGLSMSPVEQTLELKTKRRPKRTT